MGTKMTFGYWLKTIEEHCYIILYLTMSLVTEQMMIQKDNQTESSFLTYPALGLCRQLQALLGQDERHVL